MAGKLTYENAKRITEVVLAARQCGLSYGKYVQLTGGKVPPPAELVLKANPGAMSCPVCGKWFLPTGRRQIYCTPACRKTAYDRRNA